MLFENNVKKNNIRKRRVLKGWTQKELAEKVGVCFNLLRKYENNELVIKYTTVKKLCDIFGISIEQLYD